MTLRRDYVPLPDGGQAPGDAIQCMPFGSVSTHAYTGSASQITLGATTEIVQFFADTDVYVAVGTNPTATNTSWLAKGGTYFAYTVPIGSKISVLAASTGGNIRIMEA